jgi:hypothetical protein
MEFAKPHKPSIPAFPLLPALVSSPAPSHPTLPSNSQLEPLVKKNNLTIISPIEINVRTIKIITS